MDQETFPVEVSQEDEFSGTNTAPQETHPVEIEFVESNDTQGLAGEADHAPTEHSSESLHEKMDMMMKLLVDLAERIDRMGEPQ